MSNTDHHGKYGLRQMFGNGDPLSEWWVRLPTNVNISRSFNFQVYKRADRRTAKTLYRQQVEPVQSTHKLTMHGHGKCHNSAATARFWLQY